MTAKAPPPASAKTEAHAKAAREEEEAPTLRSVSWGTRS